MLDAGAITAFLQDPETWPAYPDQEDAIPIWLTLAPVREAALRRLAVLDLRGGLGAFPHDAAILLGEAARANGPLALRIWRDAKEEWAQARRDTKPPVLWNSTMIEGVGEVPLLDDTGRNAEQCALAALGAGWAASDPEGAWNAVATGDFDYQSPAALAGLIEGLGRETDWTLWSARIDSLSWHEIPHEDSIASGTAPPRTDSVLKLVERWILKDPPSALEWFSRQESDWGEGEGYLPIDLFNGGMTSHGGIPKRLSARVMLYAAWVEENPEGGSRGLAGIGVPDEILADIVEWTELPLLGKARVVALMDDRQEKSELAVKLGREAARWDRNSIDTGHLIGEILKIRGLEEAARLELEAIKDGDS